MMEIGYAGRHSAHILSDLILIYAASMAHNAPTQRCMCVWREGKQGRDVKKELLKGSSAL